MFTSDFDIHRRTFTGGLLSGLLGMTFGCGRSTGHPKTHFRSGAIRVVTTTALVGDLVRNITGPHLAQVDSLMGEGVDPHLYKGSPRDVRNLAEADLIFASGLHLEGKLISVLHRLGRQKAVHLMGDELTQELADSDQDDIWIRDSGVPDPHCWFDVSIWQRLAQLVERQLSEYHAERASEYGSNLSQFKQQLDQLDSEIRRTIHEIPQNRRILITSHDAFRYFGRAYGVQVEGIQGLSTESEAGIRRTNELVEMIVTRQVPAIFVETSVSDDNVKALIEGSQARSHNLRIGGSLFSDAPGAFGTPEGTYIGMMQHNLRTFAQAMTGSAISTVSFTSINRNTHRVFYDRVAKR